MKILFLAKLDYSGLTEGICRAFHKKGFVTQIFDTKKYRKIDKYIKNNFSLHAFSKKMREFSPDIVFLVAPLFLKLDFYEILDYFKSKNNVNIFGWIGDSFTFDSLVGKKLELIDRIYYTDTGFFNIYNCNKVEYLPLATDFDIFFNKRITKDKYVCSFIASRTRYREEFLEEVSEGIDVFGPGWQLDGKKFKHHNVKRCKLGIGKVSNIYSRSSMVLNLKNENNVVNGLNQRSFDPCASGALLLHDYVADVELNYDVGNEILVFRSIEEFEELYEKYTVDIDLCRIIAKKGQEKVLSSHTYDRRVEKILSEL